MFLAYAKHHVDITVAIIYRRFYKYFFIFIDMRASLFINIAVFFMVKP